jgi:DNA polymerase sigma
VPEDAYMQGPQIDEVMESYFGILEDQMIKLVKDVEKKLDSVRKERESAISIIESLIKKTYNENGYYYPLANNNFVGIRMYGSMASGLAIDSSDVDLAVTGLDFKGNRVNLTYSS